jgi:hypothetical protein
LDDLPCRDLVEEQAVKDAFADQNIYDTLGKNDGPPCTGCGLPFPERCNCYTVGGDSPAEYVGLTSLQASVTSAFVNVNPMPGTVDYVEFVGDRGTFVYPGGVRDPLPDQFSLLTYINNPSFLPVAPDEIEATVAYIKKAQTVFGRAATVEELF